ncbi:MAG: NAD(P)-dependent alcohol dehydrogenase [Bacteroidales bacterium]|jgi:NADPH:quinone reductase-like Zn-dependent oxidoreductase|nr:NAD(P)-dependent alcohol dehydrogenase [Bacteroidales bacterium]
MKALVYDKSVRPGKLAYRDIEKPRPRKDEVLIRINSVSLNAADYRSMKMGMIPEKKIFGADISGTVEECGTEATMFSPGDEVFGDLASFGFGGLAEFVAVTEKAVVRKPSKISFEDAAALPMAGMTALQALRDKGGIKKGDKVLIVGCSGGVGTFAIQLARHFGAEVTGVCSSGNMQQSLALGADKVIDYTREKFLDAGNFYDIILAVNGGYPLSAYRRTLADKGTYVMVGGTLPQIFKSLLLGWAFSGGQVRMKSLSAKVNRTDLELLSGLCEQGVIKPVIVKQYPLSEAAEAMALLSGGHTSGKVVIINRK